MKYKNSVLFILLALLFLWGGSFLASFGASWMSFPSFMTTAFGVVGSIAGAIANFPSQEIQNGSE